MLFASVKNLIAGVICLLLICFSTTPLLAFGETRQKTILTAVRTADPIQIDGQVDEVAWSQATPLEINIQDGGIGEISVNMRALYDEDYIYLLANWPDSTRSMAKKQWAYDNELARWARVRIVNVLGEVTSLDEDRFSVMWNIDDSVENFNTAGCAMLCHGDRMHTNGPSERVDIWHWKSARSNPLGYVDDKWLSDKKKKGYESDDLEAAHHGDERNRALGIVGLGSNYAANSQTITIAGQQLEIPRYWEPEAEGDDALVLTQAEIIAGEAVEISDFASLDRQRRIPGYILLRPEGSRGDIDAGGQWQQGRWTLEMRRKLDTGNPDDVRFDVTRLYRFGIAVMDNAGGFDAQGVGHSFDLGARTLEFGGRGIEEITSLALIRDHLLASQKYCAKQNYGLALTELNIALSQFMVVAPGLANLDPSFYLQLKSKLVKAKRTCAQDEREELLGQVDQAIYLMQGKMKPVAPTWIQTLASWWGMGQGYVFILLGLFTLAIIYQSASTIRKTEFRLLGVFILLIFIPILFESLGRLGILLQIPFLQYFSFMTSETATILWALLIIAALLISRAGFTEIETVLVDLREQKAVVEKLSVTDSLTEIANRRYFDRVVAEKMVLADRYQAPQSLLILDIDHFKLINDKYGHPCGDYLLKNLAQLLQGQIRGKIDTLARIGGEEFAIILSNTGLNQALEFAERIRMKVESSLFSYDGWEIEMTVSIGVASVPAMGVDDEWDLVAKADKALYRAKAGNRNCVMS